MSRIWDVDGIEWEDLPTVSDLLCAADTKILAREVALRYGGKPGGRGRVDNERSLKRARRKVKKLRKVDPEPSDKIVLLPKHVINRRDAGHGFDYYDVEPCAFTRGGAQKLGEDACAEVYPWDLFLLNEEPASVILGYRVWLGGEWDLCERYRFLAVVCASALHRFREQKELCKCLKKDDANFLPPKAMPIRQASMLLPLRWSSIWRSGLQAMPTPSWQRLRQNLMQLPPAPLSLRMPPQHLPRPLGTKRLPMPRSMQRRWP